MKLLLVMQGLTSVKLPIHSARLLSKSRLMFWLVHQAAGRKVNIKLKIWRLFFKHTLMLSTCSNRSSREYVLVR